MKKLLKKVLALPLCALMATPFSAVFACAPYRPELNIQREVPVNIEQGVINLMISGRLWMLVDDRARRDAEPAFTRDPALRNTFEEKISEYRRLLGEVNLSNRDKNSLRRFFASAGLGIINLPLFLAPTEDDIGQLVTNIANADLRVMGIFRCISRDGAGISSFIRATVEEFANNPSVCAYFSTHCLRILLV